MNDDAWAEQCRNLLILTEGFPTYGGLAGSRPRGDRARDSTRCVDEDYLRYRIRSTAYLGDALVAARRADRRADRRPRRLSRRRARCCPTSRRCSTRGRRSRRRSTAKAASAAARSGR